MGGSEVNDSGIVTQHRATVLRLKILQKDDHLLLDGSCHGSLNPQKVNLSVREDYWCPQWCFQQSLASFSLTCLKLVWLNIIGTNYSASRILLWGSLGNVVFTFPFWKHTKRSLELMLNSLYSSHNVLKLHFLHALLQRFWRVCFSTIWVK